MRYQWFQSQFHYGSIKTEWFSNKASFSGMSQFHYGSIKTAQFGISRLQDKLVSIPLWFD